MEDFVKLVCEECVKSETSNWLAFNKAVDAIMVLCAVDCDKALDLVSAQWDTTKIDVAKDTEFQKAWSMFFS